MCVLRRRTLYLGGQRGRRGNWQCLASNGSSWSCSSNRNLKENFEPVDGRATLTLLADVPILEWNAQGADPNVKHVGPMAQDFYAAFGLGQDDTMISTIDLDGVALAAIQGLSAISEEQAATIQGLAAENAALRARLDGLEARLATLQGVPRCRRCQFGHRRRESEAHNV